MRLGALNAVGPWTGPSGSVMLTGPHGVGALRWAENDERPGAARDEPRGAVERVGGETASPAGQGSPRPVGVPGFRRRRRANVEGGRVGSHRVRTSPAEEALLVQLAAAQGVTVPRLLVESALAGDRETAVVRRDAIVELFAVRRLLAAVSNNVNQVARHANAGEVFPAEASATLAAVRRLVPRIDAAVDALAQPVRAREVLQAGRQRQSEQSPSVTEAGTDWAALLDDDGPTDTAGGGGVVPS